MNAPSVDIKDILLANVSLGLTFAINLFVNKEPDSPNNCVTIYDTGEFAPLLTMQKGENYYYPTIQIRVRNNSYTTGYRLITSIRDILHGINHEVWNSTHYEFIQCMSGPELLNYDENNRAILVINFNIQRQ